MTAMGLVKFPFLLLVIGLAYRSVDLHARPFRCFVAVATTGSFRRAAASLNMSQPALSGQIRELERRVGFDLFVRGGRSVTITAEGKLFLPSAKRMIAESDIINHEAFAISTNQLRIAATLYTALIPERVELIERFSVAHPQVPLRISDDGHAQNLALLRAGEIDLALAVFPAPPYESGLSQSMEIVPLAEREVELMLPADHPLAKFALIPRSALQGLRIARVGRFHGRNLSDALNARLLELGAEPFRPPEGNAIAVETYARFVGMPAVALCWLPDDPSSCFVRVRRPVEGFAVTSCLAMVRNRSGQRPASICFWNEALGQIKSGLDAAGQITIPML